MHEGDEDAPSSGYTLDSRPLNATTPCYLCPTHAWGVVFQLCIFTGFLCAPSTAHRNRKIAFGCLTFAVDLRVVALSQKQSSSRLKYINKDVLCILIIFIYTYIYKLLCEESKQGRISTNICQEKISDTETRSSKDLFKDMMRYMSSSVIYICIDTKCIYIKLKG